ncbi:MAG: tetratricopeptide repeat protein [Prevotellaceae bacterium]|nr:tetratricopeptide repeat protein [Prevotellaceae bacterium]
MEAISHTLNKTNRQAEETYHYQKGNECYQHGQWQEAIEHYLEACELNSDSPAREKLKMVYNILEFFNKDIYGQ